MCFSRLYAFEMTVTQKKWAHNKSEEECILTRSSKEDILFGQGEMPKTSRTKKNLEFGMIFECCECVRNVAQSVDHFCVFIHGNILHIA